MSYRKARPTGQAGFQIDLKLLTASSTPLQGQIYERVRSLVASGKLAAGARLPSVRSLSSELGVARGTVEAAYARLIGEGYLIARGPRGTFAAPGARASRGRVDGDGGHDERAHRIAEVGHGKLQIGMPAFDAFPRKSWARIVARNVRSASPLSRPQPCGFTPLRESISMYLYRARGIACSPAQVIVVPGYAAALAMVAQTLLAAGDSAHTESPGYPPTTWTLQRYGIRCIPTPVDAQGLQVEHLRAHGARLAVVTPSHQSPLGVSLSLQRRIQLLEWAQRCNGWILEDDYDGEFRYRGSPLPALKSLDSADRVLFFGTFSKVLFPGLRLSYVVVPRSQVELFDSACRLGLHGNCPELLQVAIHDFMERGDFARHVRKMRTLYALRRSYLADAISNASHGDIQLHLADGGMHLLAKAPTYASDVELVRRAAGRGFSIQALSNWYPQEAQQQGLLLGFTNLISPAEANNQARDLLDAFRMA